MKKLTAKHASLIILMSLTSSAFSLEDHHKLIIKRLRHEKRDLLVRMDVALNALWMVERQWVARGGLIGDPTHTAILNAIKVINETPK